MTQTLQPADLHGMPLFEGVTPGELERVAAHLQVQSFPAGAHLFGAEQRGEVVYIIMRGAAKIYRVQAGGKGVILALLGAGEVVGEMSVVDHMGRSADAITIEDSRLLWMDHATFRRCLDEIPTMDYNLARILSRRLRLANAQIQSLSALNLHGRIAHQLLAFAYEYGQNTGTEIHIPFRLTQADLASLTGASRGRVNSVLVYFKKRGYISVDNESRITINEREALDKLCM